jgi:Family of unknown function (DUF5681)
MSDDQNGDEKIGADEPLVGAANAPEDADYKVGPGRPPKHYQWKKGQSGNPSGRPRKKLDDKALLEDLMNERIVIREDGKERKVTKREAYFRTHMAKAIKGDVRSARLLMDELTRAGVGAEQVPAALLPPNNQSAQSDALFANLNLDLLSQGDKIELARVGQVIDLGGDFTALNTRDFERAKQIAEKGRGRDITPNA